MISLFHFDTLNLAGVPGQIYRKLFNIWKINHYILNCSKLIQDIFVTRSRLKKEEELRTRRRRTEKKNVEKKNDLL